MTSRSLLHFNDLVPFKQFLESRGWQEEPTKGVYEKLRMRHKRERDPLILHTRDSASEHFTTWGISHKLAQAFIHTKKRERHG